MPIRFSLPKPKKEWRQSVLESELARFRKAGYSIAERPRHGRFLVRKKKKKWEQFEDEILTLFRHGLKLTDVDGGPAFRIGGYQLDVVGGISNTLLVVDCKSSNEPRRRSLRSEIKTLWVKKRSISNSLRSRYRGKYKHTKFALALRGIIPSDSDFKYAKKKAITIWAETYCDSIRALYFTIGERVKFYVLKELGGNVPLVPGGRGKTFSFPALRTGTPEERVYVLFMPVNILLDIAYVLRVESGQRRAYQRFLDKNRLMKIAKFLEDGETFKNSIVLALDQRMRFKMQKTRWRKKSEVNCEIGLLKVPRQFASAWVIDGQHRLYGFARTDAQLQESLLCVVALQTRNKTEEAKTFVAINKNQKPVDPNLLWALFGRLYPHETRGLISDFVRLLAFGRKSIFRDKIFVPGESTQTRKHYRLFHSNLCETIGDHLVEGKLKPFGILPTGEIREPHRSKRMNSASKILSAYFSLLADFARESGNPAWIKGFVFTNNGLNVMIRVLVHILEFYRGRLSRSEVKSTFGRGFREYLNERGGEIDHLRRQASSEGTRSFIAFGFVKALARNVPHFADACIRDHQKEREKQEPYRILRDVEERLRNLISERMKGLTPSWWAERVPPDVSQEAEERKSKDETPWPWMEGKHYPAFYYVNFSEYSKIICRRDNWREAFQSVFANQEWVRVIFAELERNRNDIAHNRDLSDRELTLLRVYSDDLERAISGRKKDFLPAALAIPA